MKHNNILKSSVLALAGAVLLVSQSAHAGNAIVTFGDNDLLMGLRATVAPGNTINLELNLGSADSYYNPNSNTTPGDFAGAAPIPNIGRLSVDDLTATYGASWASRVNLFWGIAGAAGSSGSFDGWFSTQTVYLSRPETTPGVQTTPWDRQLNFNNANTQIGSLGGTGGYTGTSTANSDYDLQVAAANANSYQSRSQAQSGQTFAAVNGLFQNDTIMSSFTLSPTQPWLSVVDMFAMEPGATTAGLYIGSFGIRQDGTMAYSPTASYFAVPEPSAATYLLGACIFGAVRRRRSGARAV